MTTPEIKRKLVSVRTPHTPSVKHQPRGGELFCAPTSLAPKIRLPPHRSFGAAPDTPQQHSGHAAATLCPFLFRGNGPMGQLKSTTEAAEVVGANVAVDDGAL